MALRKLVAGNWKMNGVRASLSEVAVIETAAAAAANVDVALCPPFTLIDAMMHHVTKVAVGGQDCHPGAQGAHTGCISAAMLADLSARYVIVGHSERRTDNGETSDQVRAKAEAAIGVGLIAIVCVGEHEAERDAGRAVLVVSHQLDGSIPPAATAAQLVVAYEPVWAIGTGRTPTVADVGSMHGAIRAKLRELVGEEAGRLRILYGGSVTGDNAADLLGAGNVDGALVGGASLTAAKFLPIIEAAG